MISKDPLIRCLTLSNDKTCSDRAWVILNRGEREREEILYSLALLGSDLLLL